MSKIGNDPVVIVYYDGVVVLNKKEILFSNNDMWDENLHEILIRDIEKGIIIFHRMDRFMRNIHSRERDKRDIAENLAPQYLI